MSETLASRRAEPLGGNTNTGVLKLIALACMFTDHLGASCFTGNTDLRVIGRIAFPLYCWCLVVGACRTRSMPRYMLRLALVGLISQPIYMVALNHPWNIPNIFLTLLLGLAGIWGLRAKRWGSAIWAPLLAMMGAILLNCDAASYGWKGVLLMLLLYAARGSWKTIVAVMIPFCLYWGSSTTVTSIFGISLSPLLKGDFSTLTRPFLALQSLALLSLPLMIWPEKVQIAFPKFLRREDGPASWSLRTGLPPVRMPAWLGYSIYPLHLAALIGVQYAMGKKVHWEHLINAWKQLTALFS